MRNLFGTFGSQFKQNVKQNLLRTKMKENIYTFSKTLKLQKKRINMDHSSFIKPSNNLLSKTLYILQLRSLYLLTTQ